MGEARRPSAVGAELADGCRTQLGGALYLINLMGWLGLPGAWDDRLGGWAALEALARGLLGADSARYAGDPLWPALAALDGREPEQPLGAALPEPAAFRLPAAWLRRCGPPQSTWLTAAGAGRLRLADAGAGYLVADLPLEGKVMDVALAEEIARYGEEGVAATAHPASDTRAAAIHNPESEIRKRIAPAAAWWLARALPFVRWLLARALDDPSPAAIVGLIAVRGRLVVGRTHVDLHLPIDRINIAARRAGLDRDPGWAPDLGRIVLFHFE